MFYQGVQPVFPTRRITVTGEGKLSVQPSYAEIQLEVITEGADVRGAQQENANIMNQVIQALISLNIPREDIQTASFNVSPMYDYIEGKQVFRGYEVSNAITVKVKDISQVGTIIDTAVQYGVNRVSGIQFKIENVDPYYQQALRLALHNAQMKANTIAETMNLPIYPLPIDIVEESEGEPPILYKTFAMSEQSVTTPIEPGEILISATVRVKFQY